VSCTEELVAPIEARRVCEQAHQQLKGGTLGRCTEVRLDFAHLTGLRAQARTQGSEAQRNGKPM
jgi:hypothetical protein